MSTRALIAKELKNGKYKTIYCHNDGYPKGVGKTLLTEYNTEEKLDALLNLGDLSILGKQLAPDPTKPHEHLDWQRDVTLAYGRDIGEKGTEAREYTYRRLLKASDADYIYVLGKDGAWLSSKVPQRKRLPFCGYHMGYRDRRQKRSNCHRH